MMLTKPGAKTHHDAEYRVKQPRISSCNPGVVLKGMASFLRWALTACWIKKLTVDAAHLWRSLVWLDWSFKLDRLVWDPLQVNVIVVSSMIKFPDCCQRFRCCRWHTSTNVPLACILRDAVGRFKRLNSCDISQEKYPNATQLYIVCFLTWWCDKAKNILLSNVYDRVSKCSTINKIKQIIHSMLNCESLTWLSCVYRSRS